MDAGIYRMLEVMLRDLEFGLEESSEFVRDTLLALEVQGQISRLRMILANNKPGRPIRGSGPPPMGETIARRRGKGKKRKASAWNTFVKTEMPKVLKAHPRFTPQRAMKEVSKRWRSSPKNPNRGRRKR